MMLKRLRKTFKPTVVVTISKSTEDYYKFTIPVKNTNTSEAERLLYECMNNHFKSDNDSKTV